MCDYSLCGIPNRLAVEHEELVLHRFQSCTIGLVSLPEIQQAEAAWRGRDLWSRVRDVLTMTTCEVTAVCLPPGSWLILKGIPRGIRRTLGVQSSEKVQFIQTSAAVNIHRDAVQFRNGRYVSLQSLRPGMRAEILSLQGVDLAVRLGEDAVKGIDDAGWQSSGGGVTLPHGFP
jgi:hypothetical protein